MTTAEALNVIQDNLTKDSLWREKAIVLLMMAANYKSLDMEKFAAMCLEHAKA